jgi:hypothetical protein
LWGKADHICCIIQHTNYLVHNIDDVAIARTQCPLHYPPTDATKYNAAATFFSYECCFTAAFAKAAPRSHRKGPSPRTNFLNILIICEPNRVRSGSHHLVKSKLCYGNLVLAPITVGCSENHRLPRMNGDQHYSIFHWCCWRRLLKVVGG